MRAHMTSESMVGGADLCWEDLFDVLANRSDRLDLLMSLKIWAELVFSSFYEKLFIFNLIKSIKMKLFYNLSDLLESAPSCLNCNVLYDIDKKL